MDTELTHAIRNLVNSLNPGDEMTVDGFIISMSEPRTRRKYKAAAGESATISDELIEKHTTSTDMVNWKAVCEEAGIEVSAETIEPRITIEIME